MSHPLDHPGVEEGVLKFIGMAAITEENLFQKNIMLFIIFDVIVHIIVSPFSIIF